MLQVAVATLWLVVVWIERQLPVGVLPVSSVPAPEVGPAGRFSVRDHRRTRCQGLPYCGGEVWGAIQVRFRCCQRQREGQCLFCGVPCGVVGSLTDRCSCCWHCCLPLLSPQPHPTPPLTPALLAVHWLYALPSLCSRGSSQGTHYQCFLEVYAAIDPSSEVGTAAKCSTLECLDLSLSPA